MAKQFRGGTQYTTDDLIRMAKMGNFGHQFSQMLGATFTRHKMMDHEIKRLQAIIAEYESAQVSQEIANTGLYDDVEAIDE